MKRTLITFLSLTFLSAATVLAQGRGQGNGPGGQNGPGPGTGTSPIDVTAPVTVQGQVVSFSASAGSGMPSLVLRDGAKDYTFVLGPYRYLSALGFAAQSGDSVKVTYFACSSCENGQAVSQVVNLTRNLTLNLRSADGVPLWKGRGGWGGGHGFRGQGSGNGPAAGNGPAGLGQGQTGAPRCGGSGPDMTRVATIEGTVKSFTGGPGMGQPELVLTTAAGEKEFHLSPYRALAAAGYQPAQGSKMKVTAAPVTIDGAEEWVVVSFEDVTSGFKLTLRDPQTGIPARGRCRA